MPYFASCFLVGLLATLLIMRWSIRHGSMSADHDLSGPQKFHSRPVPRVGGAAVVIAILAGVVIAHFNRLQIGRASCRERVCYAV